VLPRDWRLLVVESRALHALSSGGEDPANETPQRRSAGADPALGLAPLLDVTGLARLLRGRHALNVPPRLGERRVPHLKCGHHVRFDPAQIARWLDGQRVAADTSGRARLDPDRQVGVARVEPRERKATRRPLGV
jgi:hypothetical protein